MRFQRVLVALVIAGPLVGIGLHAREDAVQRRRPGRSSLPPATTDTAFTFNHGGLERRYLLHRPSALTASPAPLVVVLHGGGSGGAAEHVALIRQATRFDAKADRERFVAVYPEAVDGYWNDGRGLRQYSSQARNIDDVGFLVALIDDVAARMPIARDRVFLTGASNGAMMTFRVGCERPERFAAIAAVIGNWPVRLNCSPGGRLPVLMMNGTEDPLMPWGGGEVRFGPQRLGEVLSAEATAARWANASGCAPSPVSEALPDRAPRDGTRVFRNRFTSCRADVVSYRIEGGGHTWPGGPQQTASVVVGRTSHDIDATDHIWEFFDRATARRGATPFGAPMRVTINGYDGNAMEPAISKDGETLFFNDQKEPNPDKNLFWARRVTDDVFQFMGEVGGVNSPAVEASPAIDRDGVLFFTSLRDYPGREATLFRGRFAGGGVPRFEPIPGDLYRSERRWVSLDPDVTPDAGLLFFTQGLFGGSAGPREMDIRVAARTGGDYRIDPRSDAILANVNTAQHLEFAPAISADALELFFTRAEKARSGEVQALRILVTTRANVADAFGPAAIVESISGFVEAPSLSSDGRVLYFHRKDGGRFFVYRVVRERSR